MGGSNSKSNEGNKEFSNANNNLKVVTKLIQVRIKTHSGIWEKPFNIEETLEKIASNFKVENNMDTINENYYIQWTYNDSPIEMNSKKLKTFISENNISDSLPVEFNQKIKPKEGRENMMLKDICEIVGKPLYNPFEIVTFEPHKKSMRIKKYNNKLITSSELYKFSIESAYCNGKNHLFISGGVDSSTKGILDLFWDIDLKGDELNPPIQIIPKKNHSMIYTENKVYIIGGHDLNTIMYDVGQKIWIKFADLNVKRFEPSLIRHNNYLFCFDSTSGKDNKFSIEKIDLNVSQNPEWEIIYPNVSFLAKQNVFCQKFFGLVEDYSQNIIFLGGIYDNTRDENFGENDIKMNIRYNVNKNQIEKSDIKFQEIILSEKTFLPIDDKTFFILPNFSKRSAKIVYFNRENNKITISPYKSNTTEIKKVRRQNNISAHTKTPWIGLNFDMPGVHNDLNNNYNLNIIEPENNYNYNFNIQGPNYNNNVKTMDKSKLFTNGGITTNLDYDNNIEVNINKESHIKKNFNNENMVELNTNYLAPNIEVENNYYEKSNDQNNNNIKINSNIDNLNQDNINPNVHVNIDSNIINNNIDIKPDSDINVNKDIYLNIIPEKADNDIKSDIQIHPVKVEKSNNEIKIDIKENKKKDEKRELPNRTYVRVNKNNKVNFHNSVDDPCNDVKKIKVKDLSYPKVISLKLIRFKAKQILKANRDQILTDNY